MRLLKQRYFNGIHFLELPFEKQSLLIFDIKSVGTRYICMFCTIEVYNTGQKLLVNSIRS